MSRPYDEAYEEDGSPRPHYAELLGSLDEPGALRAEAMRRLGARGVTFGDGETARFDPVPRILTEAEWSELQDGIAQRLRALEAFLVDVYGEGRVFDAGVVTREEVESSPHHEPAMHGVVPRRWVTFAGLDVVRCEDGRFRVIDQPAGLRRLPVGAAPHTPSPPRAGNVGRAMATRLTSTFLAAAQGRIGSHTPVWFMRQAGRSLPEYRAVRGEGSILDAIKQPDLAAEITLQPVRRYGVDAAVLYSDIVVPAHAVGFGIDVAPGTGPVAAEPLRDRADLDRLRPLEPEATSPYVAETVASSSPPSSAAEVPVLAFAGAPFTVASYLIEGRPSRDVRAHQGAAAHRRARCGTT